MTVSAKIVADSRTEYGHRVTTLELEYPRIIHAELLTHNVFSKNSASSRAIPVEKMIERIRTMPAMPFKWGTNQPGMQAGIECNEFVKVAGVLYTREEAWLLAMEAALEVSSGFAAAGYHKQVCNRLSEPYQHMKVVFSGTEFDNFFALRDHEAADPTLQELAANMLEAMNDSTPRILQYGDWHMPYYGEGLWDSTCIQTLNQALKISTSLCAQVSYRKEDDTFEKAEKIWKMLMESTPVHASPAEHQATPVPYHLEEYGELTHYWEEGITHQDRYNNAWSGNFKHWIQHRQLIPNNVCNRYDKLDHCD